MKKKLVFLALMIVAMVTFTACGGGAKKEAPKEEKKTEATADAPKSDIKIVEGDSIKKIKEKGKLVVGTSPDYPPYEFKVMKDGKMEIVGFEMALAKKIADTLGVELEIKEMDFKILIESVKKGEIDMVLAGLSATPERKEVVAMSHVLYDATQTALVRAEDVSKYTSPESLKGMAIGAQMGTIQVDMAKTQIPDSKITELPQLPALIADLTTKKIEAIVVETDVAKPYASKNKDIAVANFKLKDDEQGTVLAVAKENTDLLDASNEIIDAVVVNGEMQKYIDDASMLANESN